MKNTMLWSFIWWITNQSTLNWNIHIFNCNFNYDKPILITRIFGVDLSNFVLHELLHVRAIVKVEAYSEPSRTSKMKLSVGNLFFQKAPSQMFDCVLNTPLQGSSDYHLPVLFWEFFDFLQITATIHQQHVVSTSNF